MTSVASRPPPLASRPSSAKATSAPTSSSSRLLSSKPTPRIAVPISSAKPRNVPPSSARYSMPPTNASQPTPLPMGKDTSSSAGKVFAKPTKEWVLPERAKPGRKVAVEDPENTRQSQNRLSQRAHRARRTDYIQTLEERIRLFEADEIHSNVRLQEVARALKADNERLKAEVKDRRAAAAAADARLHQSGRGTSAELRDEGTMVGWAAERRSLIDEMRRLREEVQFLRYGEREGTSGVGSRRGSGALSQAAFASALPLSAGTTNPLTRAPLACPICPDPDPDCPCQRGIDASRLEPIAPISLSMPIKRSPTKHSCGLCSTAEECLCRIVNGADSTPAPQLHMSPSNGTLPSTALPTDDGCGLCTSASFCACRVAESAISDRASAPLAFSANAGPAPLSPITNAARMAVSTSTSPSAAVPLRARTKRVRGSMPVWTLDNHDASASSRLADASCTGDPNNCDACRNDSFGQEFCGHLFGQAAAAAAERKRTRPLSSAPFALSQHTPVGRAPDTMSSSSSSDHQHATVHTVVVLRSTRALPGLAAAEIPADPLAPLLMACCGEPALCGHRGGGACAREVIGIGGKRGRDRSQEETMRPEQAWRTLKAHPNSKFASLALLADVVARRNTAAAAEAGSTPVLASPLPVDTSAPPSPATRAVRAALSAAGGHRRDVRTDDGVRPRSGPGPGPGFSVEARAVREALRMLDETAPGEREGGVERIIKRRRV